VTAASRGFRTSFRPPSDALHRVDGRAQPKTTGSRLYESLLSLLGIIEVLVVFGRRLIVEPVLRGCRRRAEKSPNRRVIPRHRPQGFPVAIHATPEKSRGDKAEGNFGERKIHRGHIFSDDITGNFMDTRCAFAGRDEELASPSLVSIEYRRSPPDYIAAQEAEQDQLVCRSFPLFNNASKYRTFSLLQAMTRVCYGCFLKGSAFILSP